MNKAQIVFDGGAKPNPGEGYGSFKLSLNGEILPAHRLKFGPNCSNNSAEWKSLLAALETLAQICEPAKTQVEIYGDSNLVIYGASRKWKVKKPHLKLIAAKVFLLQSRFSYVRHIWWSRDNSVRLLGH